MVLPSTKIKKSELKAFLLLFPFIEVHVFNVGYLYNIAIFIAVLYVAVLFLKKRIILKKEYIPLLLYAVWLTLSCALNHGSMIPGIYYGMKLFAFTQIVEYYVQRKDITLLMVTRKYITFCLIVTTIFQYVNQDFFGHLDVSGNYNNFAFGDNVMGYYYIPFIAVCIVLDRMNGEKISKYTWTMIVFSLLSLLKAWSAKSIVGIALIVVYVMFIYGRKLSKVFNLFFVVVAYALAEIGLVFFNIQTRFSYIIESILHKDATLTGRTGLWYNALNNIRNSPIYGYGVMNGGGIYLNTTFVGSTTHSSHNLILEMLMQTGFVGLALWTLYIILSLSRNRTNVKADSYNYYMLVFFVFVVLIMQLTSGSLYIPFYYLPIVLCANNYELFSEGWRGLRK